MIRRDFLKIGLAGGMFLGTGRHRAWAEDSRYPDDREVMKGLRAWDAHAHPHSFFTDRPDVTTPTLSMMKKFAHVGLGTDGGGRLPRTVEGFRDVGDLPKLVRALAEAGLERMEISAYLGGNLERVVRACLG